MDKVLIPALTNRGQLKGQSLFSEVWLNWLWQLTSVDLDEENKLCCFTLRIFKIKDWLTVNCQLLLMAYAPPQWLDWHWTESCSVWLPSQCHLWQQTGGGGRRGGDVKTTTPSETVNCPFKDGKQRGSTGALQQRLGPGGVGWGLWVRFWSFCVYGGSVPGRWNRMVAAVAVSYQFSRKAT